MKQESIKALDAQALQDSIKTEQEYLRKLNFAHAISPIENPRRITHTRKLIAQLKTEQSAREIQVKS